MSAPRLAHELLRAVVAERALTQEEMARALSCSRPNISQLLAGKYKLSDARKFLARDLWGIPLDAWCRISPRSLGQVSP